jgi:hypothetical protein
VRPTANLPPRVTRKLAAVKTRRTRSGRSIGSATRMKSMGCRTRYAHPLPDRWAPQPLDEPAVRRHGGDERDGCRSPWGWCVPSWTTRRAPGRAVGCAAGGQCRRRTRWRSTGSEGPRSRPRRGSDGTATAPPPVFDLGTSTCPSRGSRSRGCDASSAERTMSDRRDGVPPSLRRADAPLRGGAWGDARRGVGPVSTTRTRAVS